MSAVQPPPIQVSQELFQVILQIQSCESKIIAAMLRNDGKAEAELRGEMHALLDRKLDVQYEQLRALITNMK